MKQTHRCPKCAHDRILHITQPLPSIFRVQQGGDTRPTRLAIAPPIETPMPFGIKVVEPQYVGEMEAAVCRRCGFIELYAKNVDALQPDGVYIRELQPLPG